MKCLRHGINDMVWNRPFSIWISPLRFIHLKTENNTMALYNYPLIYIPLRDDIYSPCVSYSFPRRVIFIHFRYHIHSLKALYSFTPWFAFIPSRCCIHPLRVLYPFLPGIVFIPSRYCIQHTQTPIIVWIYISNGGELGYEFPARGGP